MTARLRYIAQVNPPTPEFDNLANDAKIPFLPLEAIWPGERFDPSRLRPKVEVLSGYTRFREDDILVPKITPTFQADRTVIATGIVGGVGTATTEVHVVRVDSHAEKRFIRYLLSSKSFLDEGEAAMTGVAGQKRVPDDLIRNLPIPVLDVRDQRTIADSLDTETTRIDTLLSTKQRMIELFRARTDALIEHETGKLRGHYKEVPLKRLVREIDQRLGERTPPEMLSVSIHLGVVPRSLMTDKLPRADELSAYKMCEPDDIVLNRMRAFQGGVGRSPQTGIVSPDYAVFRPCNLVLSQYLHYIFRSPWFIGEMTARLRGIGDSEQGNVRTPRINVAALGLIKVPLPSMAIQAQLVEKIDSKVAQMRTIVEKLSHQIDLLREHRQALITAAVTGELEIPVSQAVA
jgi:type I restriction enzyme S subunit